MKQNTKFDIATCKKLLSDYAQKVNYYMKDNQILRQQLNDLKTTLEINKNLLYEQMGLKLKEKGKNILKELKNENAKLESMNQELINAKGLLSKKLYDMEQELIEQSLKFKDQIEERDNNIFILENNIKEKDALILHFEKELHKYYKNDYQSEKEIIITIPDIVNVEMNNELNASRELIIKYGRIIQEDNKREKELKAKIDQLNEKIFKLKKGKQIIEKIENIETFGYLMSSSSSSSSEANNSMIHQDSQGCNILDSPTIEFPSKIKMSKYICTDIEDQKKCVPKLDLSKVIKKYTGTKNKINVVNNEKKSNGSSDEYIAKLKYQLKLNSNLMAQYKKKFAKMKKVIQMFKQTIHNRSVNTTVVYENEVSDQNMNQSKGNANNNSHCNSNSMKYVLKDLIPNGNDNNITNSMVIHSGAELSSFIFNNDSMTNNFSVLIEDASKDPEEEFNKILREYSKPLNTNPNEEV